jgi:pimeloyl-ACP methyl ester carboxylesterase
MKGHLDPFKYEPQKCFRGQVEVDGDKVGYTLSQLDGRDGRFRSYDKRPAELSSSLNILIPGHGQTPAGVWNLMQAIVRHSPSHLVWCVDVDPPPGGDPVKAQALIKVVRERVGIDIAGPETGEGEDTTITLLGWSHGGAEALRAAEMAPTMFRHVVALCPSGLVERQLGEFVATFVWEYLTAVGEALIRRDGSFHRVAAVAWNALGGVLSDAIRSRSLGRIVNDLRWSTRKIVGPGYSYDGKVVILFGERDDVIRWEQVFPGCAEPGQVFQYIDHFREVSFPCVGEFGAAILEGDHMAPEILASIYVQAAFDLLGLDPDHRR